MGRSLAEGLAMAGANVVVSSRKQDACDATAAAINELVGEQRAIGVACNIGHKDQLEALVETTHKTYGEIDIKRCPPT